MSLLVKSPQSLIDFRRYSGQMDGMHDRNFLYNGTTGKGWPIEGVRMDYIEFMFAQAQLQEEFEKCIGLGQETCIDGTFLARNREIGWAHRLWYQNLLNGNARNKRACPGKKRYMMSPLEQSLCEIGHHSLCTSDERLSNGRHQGGYKGNFHSAAAFLHSPRYLHILASLFIVTRDQRNSLKHIDIHNTNHTNSTLWGC